MWPGQALLQGELGRGVWMSFAQLCSKAREPLGSSLEDNLTLDSHKQESLMCLQTCVKVRGEKCALLARGTERCFVRRGTEAQAQKYVFFS